MELPETQYAKSDDVYVAYQVFGGGSLDLVFVPGFTSQLDYSWDEPSCASWLHRLGRFARVILFDKRGTGLSDRVDPLPGMDERMDDIRAVMDAAGSERAAIYGLSEGGTLATLFAATHPKRCSALVLIGAFARFKHWFATDKDLDELFQYIQERWGTGGNLDRMAPSRANDPAFRAWWARRERSSASPSSAMALMRVNSQIDVADILPSIKVPTLVIHRTDDLIVNVEGGRELAKLIPNARLLELPGNDHLPFVGNGVDKITDEIEEFLTGSRAAAFVDRVLATILFTDIVGSTERAEELGDKRWRQLLDEHDAVVRRELSRFRGIEIKTTGDGFLATFDGPARGVHCALNIGDALRPLGVEIRAGLHTGEVELQETDLSGIAVHVAARISSQAGAGDVLVSRTVRDLVAGANLHFAGRGQHELKGLSEPMDLYAASATAP